MKGIESDLADLERTLRRLESEYEQFLTGKVRVQPLKTEEALQSLIRVYSTRGIQNPALRFRYANIVARYNSFKNVWDRRVRELEEGRFTGRPLRSLPKRQAKLRTATGEPVKKTFLASDLRLEKENMTEIFESYRSLRAEFGEGAEKLRLENFTRLLSEKVERLKESRQCSKVEIRLRQDKGTCRILVRPVRTKK